MKNIVHLVLQCCQHSALNTLPHLHISTAILKSFHCRHIQQLQQQQQTARVSQNSHFRHIFRFQNMGKTRLDCIQNIHFVFYLIQSVPILMEICKI